MAGGGGGAAAWMDPEAATELVRKGSTLLLLGVPQRTLFGIDTQVFSVGPKFKGMKMVPPGPHFVYYCSSSRKEFDAEQESKREEYEKVHPVKDSQDEGYPKGLIVAFKLKIIADPVVQNNEDKGNDSVAKLDTSNSMENPSGETSEERIPGSTDSKGEEAPDNMVKEKEVREATESEKCTSDALVESENQGNSGSLGRDVKNAISREAIKEVIKKFGTVRYVDFSIGDDSGYLRFEDSKAAEKARMASVLADEGGLIIKDHIITLEPVTGEAEKDYWSRIRGFQENHKDNRSYKGRAAKNYRGGKQFNGKRGRNPDAEKNSNKAQKVEAAA